MKGIVMLHTFVICAYKESPYIEECIQSCVSQNSVEESLSEVIVYTSTPNAYLENLVKKYNLALYTSSGGSIGKDWNNALSYVNTPLATIVHQDDIYLPSYGTRIIDEFTNKKRLDLNIVFCDYKECDNKGNLKPRNINLKIKQFALKFMSISNNKMYQRRIYAMGNFICCPSVTYNLKRLKNFKFNENLKMTLDWDAWERIMKMPGNVKFIDEKLMFHRIHEDSETTANTKDKTREEEEFLMYKRYWGENISRILMKFYVLNQRTNQ